MKEILQLLAFSYAYNAASKSVQLVQDRWRGTLHLGTQQSAQMILNRFQDLIRSTSWQKKLPALSAVLCEAQ